jgi:hypothetical protein
MDTEAPQMTLATQAVLRRLIEDPTAECYGLELSAATGLPSGTVHLSWPVWRRGSGWTATGRTWTR